MEGGETPIKSIATETTRPPRLPTTWEFRARLFKLRHTQEVTERPPVPDTLTAIDLARYGQVDWEHIYGKDHRGKSLASYLHWLASHMRTREGYLGTTEDGQLVDSSTSSLHVGNASATRHIQVRDEWSIGWDGSHRLLVLKLLGPEFVKQSGMDKWVKVVKK